MEVTVIGNTSTGWAGVVSWAAGATRVGEIYVDNANDMVIKVLAAVGTNNIKRLNILDHDIVTRTKLKTGVIKSIGIDIGKDVINQYNVDGFKSLRSLKSHFAQDGFVHLQHCYIGINQDLLRKLSMTWGVPVYGGTGAHHAVLRINLGKYVRCDPNGTCEMDVDRP
jgi:hypothetical protein